MGKGCVPGDFVGERNTSFSYSMWWKSPERFKQL